MRENKLYIVLVILTVTFLFATSAVCSQCGADIDEAVGGLVDDLDDNKKSEEADDSGKKEESKDTNGDKKDSDKKDEPKPEDKKSDDENKPPVIAGIYLDGLDPAVWDFSANGVHAVRADATDPEGGNLTFKWSGDGTIAGEDINPMSWTVPGSEGRYSLTVEVTDDKGSTAAMTADIYVIAELVEAEPPEGAEILDIKAIPGDDGKFYMGIDYLVIVTVDDPLNEIDHYYHDVEHNTLGGSMDKDGVFNIPFDWGDIDITVYIYDNAEWPGNLLDEKTVTIYVEP